MIETLYGVGYRFKGTLTLNISSLLVLRHRRPANITALPAGNRI
jgi:hypothetical protein